LLDFLFGAGTPERRWLEQWIAYPIQYPGAKLSTAVVIWSAVQGVGKSLLGETVSGLYGVHGRTITATELHDKFNSWADRTLFVLGEENAGHDRRADADRLKDLITGDMMHVERKYAERILQPNMMNFMFTSNHPDAFHLEIKDRRFGVFAIDSKPSEPEFYRQFVAWRNSASGRAALLHHLLHVDLAGFDPKGHAPETKAKLEMIEQGKTETERFVTDILSDEFIDNHVMAEVTSITALVELSKREGGSGSMNATAMGRALRKQTRYASKRISHGGARHQVISLRRPEYWEGQDNVAWAAEYTKAVNALAARSIMLRS
jgi:putative DNA primase/helicase